MPRLMIPNTDDDHPEAAWFAEDYCIDCIDAVDIIEDVREEGTDCEYIEEYNYKCEECKCELTEENYYKKEGR